MAGAHALADPGLLEFAEIAQVGALADQQPGLTRVQGPTMQPFLKMEPSATDCSIVTFSPTRQSRRRVKGPMTLPLPTLLLPNIKLKGSITQPRLSNAWGPMKVLAGSVMMTPFFIHCSQMRWWEAAMGHRLGGKG